MKRSPIRKKTEREFGFLVETLLDHCRNDFGGSQTWLPVAAGITRLGKAELVHTAARPATRDAEAWLQEALLIRVRQNRYASLAVLTPPLNPRENAVSIHLESETGSAIRYAVPYRSKRKGILSFGSEREMAANPRFFKCEA